MRLAKSLIIVGTVVLVLTASVIMAYYMGLFPTNSGISLPSTSMGDPRIEGDETIVVPLKIVDFPSGITNYSVNIGVNDSLAHSARFSDGGKAIVQDLDDSTNESISTLLGVVFTVQFQDVDKNGLVSQGDGLIITCSEPLRAGSSYLLVLICDIGLQSSVSLRT